MLVITKSAIIASDSLSLTWFIRVVVFVDVCSTLRLVVVAGNRGISIIPSGVKTSLIVLAHSRCENLLSNYSSYNSIVMPSLAATYSTVSRRPSMS